MCTISVTCHSIPDARDGFAIDGYKGLNTPLNDATCLILSYHGYTWHGLPLRHGDGTGLHRQGSGNKG